MSMTIKRESAKDDTIKEKVEGDITIYTVTDLKEALVQDLAEASTVEVNLEKISKIDTAGYQLMLMIKKEAAKLQKTLKISAASDEVKRIYTLYRQEI